MIDYIFINLKNFKWLYEPKQYVIKEDEVEVISEPHTDMWERTYYHFCNNNAPRFLFETEKNILVL